MNKLHKTLCAAAGAMALAVSSPWLLAQDSADAPAEAAAEPSADAPEGEVAEEAEAAPAAVNVKPRDSEIMPLAPYGLLLDVTNSGKHLFAVGDRGVVLVSNNGREWAQVKTPVRAALTSVSFGDENTGYAVGHDSTILKTADAGKTWTLQNFDPDPENGKPLLSVLALDANNAIAVGSYGLMLKTTDGGTTWEQADAPAVRGDELHLNKISKLGNNDLIIVGEGGTIGLSSDNGATWTKLTSPYDGSWFGAAPHGANGALLYGLRGNVYKADDVRAPQWQQVDVGTVSSFFGGAPMPDGGVALVGLAGKALTLSPAGTTANVKVTRPQTDANGTTTDKEVTGSFSAALVWANRLIVVGELGVQSAALP